METTPRLILFYTDADGRQPFRQWFDTLKDRQGRAAILARLARTELGNFGDHKALTDTDGVWELRIEHGPGYRLYYGEVDGAVAVFLCGGHKGTQRRDVARAKRYWAELQESINQS